MTALPPSQGYLSRLPQELQDEIINELYDDADALRACALTCRAFFPRAQKLLFSYITIIAGTSHKSGDYLTDRHFKDILENSPHIADYMRSVKLAQACGVEAIIDAVIDNVDNLRAKAIDGSISSCFSHLTKLECLSIDYGQDRTRRMKAPDRQKFEKELAHTLQLPTLHSLDMWSMTPGLLQYRKNLKYLCINHTLQEPNWIPNPDGSRCSVESLMVKINGNREYLQEFRLRLSVLCSSVIDITKLKRLFIVCQRSSPMQYHYILMDLLEACGSSLEVLVLDPNKDVRDPYEGATLSLKNLTALQKLHIRVNTMYDGELWPHTLPWVVDLLKTLPRRNSSRLVDLSLQVNYDEYTRSVDLPLWADF